MASRFIPTVERESIDLVYALPNSHMSELTDNPLALLVIAMCQVSIVHLLIYQSLLSLYSLE